jgi:metal-responsive CopG/Arc/MetJ family transcriptional regulator
MALALRGRRRATVIPGYTVAVKTAISVPDATYRLATERAAELGISRSELFSTAVRRYLEELDESSLVSQIDAIATSVDEDGSSRAAVDAGRRLLTDDAGDW